MNSILLVILTIGLILDLYGEMLCKGAVLSSFNKKQLVIGTGLFGIWQLFMLVCGTIVATFLEHIVSLERMEHFTTVISITIFAAFAVHMFKKAWRNDYIEERRQDDILTMKRAFPFATKIGFKTIMIGLALGFLETNLAHGMIVTILATTFVFATGMYSGYRFGYRHKGFVYLLGFLMMTATDIYLIGAYFSTGIFV